MFQIIASQRLNSNNKRVAATEITKQRQWHEFVVEEDMLAHNKGKRYKPLAAPMVSSNDHSDDESKSTKPARQGSLGSLSFEYDDRRETQLIGDVLCSLGSSQRTTSTNTAGGNKSDTSEGSGETRRKSSRSSQSKQLQLPMFLSKTYHMIDRCDPEIATWSEGGDNFVVKNVEKFAGNVLPLYFKHSNFSSFARQLNFYGFRKLRTDPILTSDVDPQTASYVRFYHEKFQKDRPELLHEIKRATKSDQQSKDEVESLKQEVVRLRETMRESQAQYDQKLAELSYECNRRIAAMSAEYDKLAALVHNALTSDSVKSVSNVATPPSNSMPAPTAPSAPQVPDLLHSLSQAAVTLQNSFHHHRQHQRSMHTPISTTPPDMSPPMKRHGNEAENVSPTLAPPLPNRPRFK